MRSMKTLYYFRICGISLLVTTKPVVDLSVGTWKWFRKAILLKSKVSISKSESNWTAELILQDFMGKEIKKDHCWEMLHCLSQIDSLYLLVSRLFRKVFSRRLEGICCPLMMMLQKKVLQNGSKAIISMPFLSNFLFS